MSGERTKRALQVGGVALAVILLWPRAQTEAARQPVVINMPAPEIVQQETVIIREVLPPTTAPLVAETPAPAPVETAAPVAAPAVASVSAHPLYGAWVASAQANGLDTSDAAFAAWLQGQHSPDETAPAATSVVVQPGDSLESIAEAHGTTSAELQALNAINGDGNEIHAGWTLTLPGGTPQDVDGPEPTNPPEPAPRATDAPKPGTTPPPEPSPQPSVSSAPTQPPSPGTAAPTQPKPSPTQPPAAPKPRPTQPPVTQPPNTSMYVPMPPQTQPPGNQQGDTRWRNAPELGYGCKRQQVFEVGRWKDTATKWCPPSQEVRL